MKSQILCALIVAAGCLATLAQADYILNVDFNGVGNNGANPTYQGTGAAGGGTTWNGLLVQGDVPLSPSMSDLLDSDGKVKTGTVFSVTGVGGGCNMGDRTDDPTNVLALQDYLYAGGSYSGYPGAFTVSGLGANAVSADVYLYADVQAAQHVGTTPMLFLSARTDGGSGNIYKATSATITGGQLTGELSPGGNMVAFGMMISVHEIPEPNTLMLLGTIGLVCGTWRKRK